jgi:hypothetical protein
LSLFIKQKKPLKNIFSSWLNPASSWSKIKNSLMAILILLRPLILITLFFTLIILLFGLIAVRLKGELIDDQLMEIDKSLFGFYPFLWLVNQVSFLGKITPLFIYAFLGLGLIVGIVWIIFYLADQRKFFSQYIIAMTSVVTIALPLWFSFPANTPQNTYLNNVYHKEINPSLKKLVKDYQANKYLLDFHKEVGVKPGDIAPVSTMPSMHVAWAIIIVYYLFQFRRKTIF